MTISRFFSLLPVLWLAAASVLSAQHQATHIGDVLSDHEPSALCQAADRDEDAVLPGVCLLPGETRPDRFAFPAPQAGETLFLLTANSRAPPFSVLHTA